MNSCTHSAWCHGGFSATDFFKDSPWLNIPEDRLGEILVEPLYPKLGLLGGTSKQESAPRSKLAALAAARKKKENLRPGDDPVVNSSVALLDKLGRKPPEVKFNKGLDLSVSVPKIENSKDASNARSRKYPIRRPSNPSTSDEPRPEPCLTTTTTPSGPSTDQQAGPALAATPSTFARTIFGSLIDFRESQNHTLDHHAMQAFVDDTKFDFAGPSPDDVVLEAQNSKYETQKPARQKPPATRDDKAPNDVIQGVEGIKIEEARAKTKNLDVLAEFEKSKPKKSANFVVIGTSYVQNIQSSIFLTRGV